MIKEIQVQLLPSEANQEGSLRQAISQYLSLKKTSSFDYEILKKSIDARGKMVKILFKVRVFIDEFKLPFHSIEFKAMNVSNGNPIHIIGEVTCRIILRSAMHRIRVKTNYI